MSAMPYRARLLHRAYSWIRGKHWIPCPFCKKGFGEHEWLAEHELWITERDVVAVCPRCGDDARQRNRDAGYPLQKAPDREADVDG